MKRSKTIRFSLATARRPGGQKKRPPEGSLIRRWSRARWRDDSNLYVGFPTAVQTASGSKGWKISVSALFRAPPAKIQIQIYIALCSTFPRGVQAKPGEWTGAPLTGTNGRFPGQGEPVKGNGPGYFPPCAHKVHRHGKGPGPPPPAGRPLSPVDPEVPIRYNYRRFHHLNLQQPSQNPHAPALWYHPLKKARWRHFRAL